MEKFNKPSREWENDRVQSKKREMETIKLKEPDDYHNNTNSKSIFPLAARTSPSSIFGLLMLGTRSR